MADIPITQAMDYHGAGEMSQADYLKGLTSSIMGGVGQAEKYGKEKSAEQKEAEEQLKRMEKLTEGLQELDDTLKKILKQTEETRKKKEGASAESGTFSNLADALSKMLPMFSKRAADEPVRMPKVADSLPLPGGGSLQNMRPPKMSNLESTALDKMTQMAEASLLNHSLGVKDTVLWDLVKSSNRHLEKIADILSQAYAKKLVKREEKERAVGAPAGDAAPGTGMAPRVPEVPGTGEGPTEALKASGKDAEELDKVFQDIVDKIGTAGGLLKEISGPVMLKLLENLRRQYPNIEDLQTARSALMNTHKLAKSSQREIQAAAIEAQRAYERGEDMEDSMRAFARATVTAGEHFQANLNNQLDKFINKLGAAQKLLMMLNPQQVFGGPALDFNPITSAAQSADIQAQIGQATLSIAGFRGDITQAAGTIHNQILRDFNAMSDDATRIGMAVHEFRQLAMRGLRRGLVGDFRAITNTATTLARQIGSDVTATSDELNTWVLRYRMTNTEARVLAQNIAQVGRITGVTGDALLNAVKSSAKLADNMKATGNYTAEAHRTMLQLATVAEQRGVTHLISPIQQALADRQGFLDLGQTNPQLRSFMIRAGSEGGLNPGQMAMGEAGTPEGQRAFTEGFRRILQQFQAQLEGMGGRNNPRALAMMSSIINAQTGGLYRGIGDLERALSALEDGTMTAAERIERLQRSLAENTNATDAERLATLNQIRMLEGSQQNDILNQFQGLLNTRVNVDGVNRQRTMQEAMQAAPPELRGQVENSLASRITDLGGTLQVGGQQMDIQQAIQEAMSSGRGFNNIVDAITKAEEQRRADETQQTDPTTKFRNSIIAWQNKFHDLVRDSFLDLLNRIPTGVLSWLTALGGISGLLFSILMSIQTLRTSMQLLAARGGAGGIGGVGAGGLGGAGQAGQATSRLGRFAGGVAAVLGPLAAFAGTLAVAGYAVGSLVDHLGGFGKIRADVAAHAQQRQAQHQAFLASIPQLEQQAAAMTEAQQNRRLEELQTQMAAAVQRDQAAQAANNGLRVQMRTWGQRFFGMFTGQEAANDVIIRENAAHLATQQEQLNIQRNVLLRNQQQRLVSGQITNMAAPTRQALNTTQGTLNMPSVLQNTAGLNQYYTENRGRDFGDDTRRALFARGSLSRQANETDLMYSARRQFQMTPDQTAALTPATLQNLFGPQNQLYQQINQAMMDRNFDTVNRLVTENRPNLDPQALSAIFGNFGATLNAESFQPLLSAADRQVAEQQRTNAILEAQRNQPGILQNMGTNVGNAYNNVSTWNRDNPFINGLSIIGEGISRLNPFAEGTREIQNTGLGILHQGEMVVPENISRHLRAEGNGPFGDSIALVRPEVRSGDNDAMMQQRIQTEFAGTAGNDSTARANATLDDISDYHREELELQKQELATLKALLAAVVAQPSGAPRPDTSPNSRPGSPPNWHDWAIRPLNQPNFGHVENNPRG